MFKKFGISFRNTRSMRSGAVLVVARSVEEARAEFNTFAGALEIVGISYC